MAKRTVKSVQKNAEVALKIYTSRFRKRLTGNRR